MNALTFWSAHALAAQMSATYGGPWEIKLHKGRYTVERAPLPDRELCPAYRKWRDALYLEFGVRT